MYCDDLGKIRDLEGNEEFYMQKFERENLR